MNYDGSIKIDTRLDTKGFNEGVKQISGSVNKLTDLVKSIGGMWLGFIAGRTVLDSLLGGLSQFSLLWSSMGKDVWNLNWAFGNLQGAWTNLLATAIEPMLPYLIQIVHWLTGIVQYVTVLIAAFLGLDKTMGNIARKTDMLAAFDKINKLSSTVAPPTSPPPITVPPDLLQKMQDLKQKIMDTWNSIASWFMTNVWNPLVGYWNSISPQLKKLWDQLMQFFSDHMGNISAIWNDTWAIIWDAVKFYATLIGGLVKLALDLMTGDWDQLQKDWNELAGNLISIALDIYNHVKDLFSNMFKIDLDIVKGLFSGLADFIKRIILPAISDAFKFTLNLIGGYIGSIINGLITDLIKILSIGSALGLNIPTGGLSTSANIPHMATGAVIPPNSKFLAMLGDQTSGKNIEAPEGLLRQLIAEELGKQSININFTGSLSALAKIMKPEIDRENVRVGNNLIKRSGQVPIS